MSRVIVELVKIMFFSLKMYHILYCYEVALPIVTT